MDGRLRHGLMPRLRVALVRLVQRHAQQRPAGQIDHVLSLVRQLRAPVFHLRDPRIGIVRVFPVGVFSLIFPAFVDLRPILTRRLLHPRLPRQLVQKIVLALAGVAATIERIAAFASNVVASTPIVFPLTTFACTSAASTMSNAAACTSLLSR